MYRFYTLSVLKLQGVLKHMLKKLYKTYCSCKGTTLESDKLPDIQVMSLVSGLVEAEDYKFSSKKKMCRCEMRRVSLPDFCSLTLISARGNARLH